MAFIWRWILEAFVAVDMTNVPITVGADKLAAGTIPPFVQCTFHAVPECLYTLHRKLLGDEGNASQVESRGNNYEHQPFSVCRYTGSQITRQTLTGHPQPQLNFISDE